MPVWSLRVGEIVALVGAGHPHGGFDAAVEHDLLGEPEAEIFLEKRAVGFDVHGQSVQVIQPANVHAARRKALRLIFQRRLQSGGGFIPLRFVIELDFVAVGILADKGRAVRQIAVGPAESKPEPFSAATRRSSACGLRVRKATWPSARLFRRGQLQRVALVIVIRAKINRIAFASAFGHAHDIDEEAQAFLGLGREQFQMAQVGQVHDGFRLHTFPWRIGRDREQNREIRAPSLQAVS